MDFALTVEEKVFQKELADFLENEMPEGWDDPQPDIYAVGRQEMEMRRKFGDKGWRTMAWPKEYGGQAATPVMQLIFKEMVSHRGAQKVEDQGIDFIGPTIIIHGTEEQKKEHLTRISKGEAFWCQGFSEPEAGSDLAGLQTRAVEDGDDYVINGRKIWTSFAHLANWMHILTRTDPDAPKHRGITYFLLDMASPGISIRPLITMAGQHHFNEVTFDNVRVPKKNMLGEKNRGWYAAMAALDFERSGIEYPGRARRLLEDVTRYAQETKVNGKTLIEEPGCAGQAGRVCHRHRGEPPAVLPHRLDAGRGPRPQPRGLDRQAVRIGDVAAGGEHLHPHPGSREPADRGLQARPDGGCYSGLLP